MLAKSANRLVVLVEIEEVSLQIEEIAELFLKKSCWILR